MTRRRTLLLVLPSLPVLAHAARGAEEELFHVAETDRLRLVARQYGWTVLRDHDAPADAAETGMVLIRVQRPVPPAERPGHLAATLRANRAFHFAAGALPAAETPHHPSGLPAAMLTARGLRSETQVEVVVRALILYGPARSLLAIASAPVAQWDALAPEFDTVLGSLRLG